MIMENDTYREELEKFRELYNDYKGFLSLEDRELFKKAATIWRAFNQVKWERDIAISQLEELGIGLGEKVDYVKELIEAKGKGLFIKLFCNVNDIVFELLECEEGFTKYKIDPMIVEDIFIERYDNALNVGYKLVTLDKQGYTYKFNSDFEIRNNVFLTLEEAEEAIAKMEEKDVRKF